jgi:hypothetical protein
MRQLSFKRHRFPAGIIRHSIWLYARLTLSYRDVEEMLAERGLDVSYETVCRWFLKFGSTIAANLRQTRPRPSDHWRLDEVVIVIRRNMPTVREPTIGPRTRISRSEDASVKCKGSSRPGRRGTSSQSTRRHTTPYIISASSTDVPTSKRFIRCLENCE